MRLYPGVSIITLGVADVALTSAFYQRLGWRRSKGASNDAISFFSLNNIVLGIFGADALYNDCGFLAPAASIMNTASGRESPYASNRTDPVATAALPGQARMVLAQNYPSELAVRQAMDEAQDAGAQVLVAPSATFWGGFHGVFADPDGHIWELAFNPFFPLAPDGGVELPE